MRKMVKDVDIGSLGHLTRGATALTAAEPLRGV